MVHGERAAESEQRFVLSLGERCGSPKLPPDLSLLTLRGSEGGVLVEAGLEGPELLRAAVEAEAVVVKAGGGSLKELTAANALRVEEAEGNIREENEGESKFQELSQCSLSRGKKN